MNVLEELFVNKTVSKSVLSAIAGVVSPLTIEFPLPVTLISAFEAKP